LCMAPLPRAYQRLTSTAYASHATLLGKEDADGGLRQAASDRLLGAHDRVVCANDASGLDFSAEIAVITADVALGASVDEAMESIRLVMLSNDWVMRHVSPTVQAQPATAFSPVAVTLDELGDAWDEGCLHLTVQVSWNGRKVGMCDAGADMTHGFGQLLAQACQTRPLQAGTILTSGPISNAGVEKEGRTEWAKGYSCIAEKRAMEIALDGKVNTEFVKLGDTVRIEAKGKDGQSVFGAIEQVLTSLDSLHL
jgi:fumarylacetoacetate (FAA) hydrolase